MEWRPFRWLALLAGISLILGSKFNPPFDYVVRRGNYLLIGGAGYAVESLKAEVVIYEGQVPYYRRATVEQFAKISGPRFVASNPAQGRGPTLINLAQLHLDPHKKYFVVSRVNGFVSSGRDITGAVFFDEDIGWVPWYFNTFVWLNAGLLMVVCIAVSFVFIRRNRLRTA